MAIEVDPLFAAFLFFILVVFALKRCSFCTGCWLRTFHIGKFVGIWVVEVLYILQFFARLVDVILLYRYSVSQLIHKQSATAKPTITNNASKNTRQRNNLRIHLNRFRVVPLCKLPTAAAIPVTRNVN